MKEFLTSLVEQWKSASGTTRGVVVIALAAVTASLWWISQSAGQPHFKLLYSNQDAQHAAAIQNALAQGGIRYNASQPPGPFVIWVDEEQYYQAQNLVALSGALETSPEGIPVESAGASQVFQSAGERQQTTMKREWQELEKQLQELDFVLRARVSTSTPDNSPLRKGAPVTVAVTLALKGHADLSRGQAQTVAKIVRYRFNVPAENVIISDQSGRSVYDGAAAGELGGAAASLLEHKARYEGELTARTNQLLDRVFGSGRSYVVVNSDWTYEERERVKESLDPKNVVTVEKTESKTSTPIAGNNSGGVSGAEPAANEFGSTNPAATAAAQPQAESKTSETKSMTIAGKETEHIRTSTPLLSRLTVSLFLDESLREKFGKADEIAALESSIKNAVGFDEKRDVFSSMITPFATVQRDENGQPVVPPAVEPESAPSPFVELLLKRGVEIASALVFLFVLFKALKSVPRSASKPQQALAGGSGGASVLDEGPIGLDKNDPKYLEMLARRQIEELVKTEPDKVGTILSRWVSDQETLART